MKTLTQEEKLTFDNFIVKTVSENVTFPSTQMGARNITIQELIHNRTIESLGEYADFLEKQAPKVSRIDRMKGIEEKTISNSDITFKEVVNFIDIVIKMKSIKNVENKKMKELSEIEEELQMLQTPEERKAILLEKKRKITGEASIATPVTEIK
jgi:predicted DNA-binding protein YlxM (UPF0122 family)